MSTNELAGQQLGDYYLTRPVAREAFVARYLGEHRRTGSNAEILIFHARVEGQAIDDFQREARRLIQLAHPGLMRILDFEIINGQAFFARDVPASSLRQVYPSGAQLPVTVVIDYLRQIGSALQFAHEHGLVHGDLRPEHVFVPADRRSVLLGNLGVMSIAQAATSTKENVVSDSPYLAPEQTRGLTTPQSDQYALAALAYEWLSGEPPVRDASSELWVLNALARKTPTLPIQAVQALQRALSPAPVSRFESVDAFTSALQQATTNLQGQAVLSPLQPSSQPVLTPLPPSPPAGQHVLTSLPSSAAPAGQPVLMPLPSSAAPAQPGSQVYPVQNPPTPGTYPPPLPALPDPTRRKLVLGLIAGGAGLLALGTGAAFFVKSRLDAGQQPRLVYSHAIDKDIIDVVPFWSPDSSRLGLFLDSEAGASWEAWDVADQGNKTHFDSFVQLVSSDLGQRWDTSWVKNRFQFVWISGLDNVIHLVDVASQKESLITLRYKSDAGEKADIETLSWSPDGANFILGVQQSGFHVWNLAQQKDIGFSPLIHLDLCWAPGGQRVVSWGTDGKLVVWQVPSGATLATYTKHAEEHPLDPKNWLSSVTVKVVEWSPNGEFIASQATGSQDNKPVDNVIHIWNARTGSEITTYDGHKDKGFTALAWSPDSTMVATADQDGFVHVWSATTGQRLFLHNDKATSALTWTPRGQRVASPGQNDDFSNVVFEIWDATTGKNVITYTEPDNYDQADVIQWSPDGQYAVTVTYGQVQVWQGGW